MAKLNAQPLIISGPKGSKMVVAEAPLRQQITGGQVLDMDKTLDQAFWDTEYFAAAGGAQKIRLFQSRQWATGPFAGQNKTLADTNMQGDGAFQAPNTYKIRGFQVSVKGDLETGVRPNLTDLQELRSCGVLSFVYGTKPIWYMPIEKLAAPAFYAQANAASNGGILNLTNYVPIDWHHLGFSIGLGPGLNFAVEISTSTDFAPTQRLRVQCKMIGVLSRSVR